MDGVLVKAGVERFEAVDLGAKIEFYGIACRQGSVWTGAFPGFGAVEARLNSHRLAAMQQDGAGSAGLLAVLRSSIILGQAWPSDFGKAQPCLRLVHFFMFAIKMALVT